MMKKLLQSLEKKAVSPPPIWFMRQAGRYLPEYRELRAKFDFLTLCKTPELAVEISLQPIRRFSLDGCILFSDILMPLEPMGLKISFGDGEGPRVTPPVRSLADVERLRFPDPERDFPYVLKTLEMLRHALPQEVALIGFAPSPFTLAAYASEGGHSRQFFWIRRWLYQDPQSFARWMDFLTHVLEEYLTAQLGYGADVVQIFDTWGGLVPAAIYEERIFPFLARFIERVKRHGPVILFGLGTPFLLPIYEACEPHGLSVDASLPIGVYKDRLKRALPLQGNLDPAVLLTDQETITGEARKILKSMKGYPFIFNLGHGLDKTTPVEHVAHLVQIVRSIP